MLRSLAVLGLLSLLAARVSAYYVPGTYPEEWNVGDVLEGESGVGSPRPLVACFLRNR